MALNFALFPLFGWQISLQQNLMLGVIYTVVSIVRSYCLRRFFNKVHSVQQPVPKGISDTKPARAGSVTKEDAHLGVGA